MPEHSLIITKDGSPSIHSDRYNASYHSLYGAIEESIHVFVSAGYYFQIRNGLKKITIFEMGFGTGLNAWLTCIETAKYGVKVEYYSIEKHPLSDDLLHNVKDKLPFRQDLFEKIHNESWEKESQISDHFSLTKIQGDLMEFPFQTSYDVIYYDAFAPSSQPDLWERRTHEILYKKLNPGGCLVTYCAQGKFKRTLKDIGYRLDPLNGPNRKHEMTRAIK